MFAVSSCWAAAAATSCSRASALLDHHFRQVALDDLLILLVVDDGHAGEPERRAARLETGQAVRFPILVEDVAVVGSKMVWRAHRATVALAVIRVVAARRYYPVVPPELVEVHVELLLAAPPVLGRRTVERTATHSLHHVGVGENHQKRSR